MGRSSRRSTTSSMKRDDTDRGAEQKAEKWPFWPLCSQDGGAEQKAEKWPFWPLCFQEAGREAGRGWYAYENMNSIVGWSHDNQRGHAASERGFIHVQSQWTTRRCLGWATSGLALGYETGS
eukprot:TRINITY_DN6902_c0_g1_i1.p1 TRINITY_DN6902_c0_g1~~TRINITY_DN6902_c0_g1_i1.p1  ORF type:complete len:122 (-),score=2.17 TRINITY_DN6902_c0_g1_i1:150-515(-)